MCLGGGADKGNNLVLATLFLSRFASSTPSIVMTLLLLEIGETFGTPVGVTGQMGTAYSIMGILAAIGMGAVSVGFNHKSLILVGLLVFSVAVLGCGVAPSFSFILVFFGYALLFCHILGGFDHSVLGKRIVAEIIPDPALFINSGAWVFGIRVDQMRTVRGPICTYNQ